MNDRCDNDKHDITIIKTTKNATVETVKCEKCGWMSNLIVDLSEVR